MPQFCDNVKEINDALDKLNAEKGWEICIHVDAATGGFIQGIVDLFYIIIQSGDRTP